jgi:hypothetical protein
MRTRRLPCALLASQKKIDASHRTCALVGTPMDPVHPGADLGTDLGTGLGVDLGTGLGADLGVDWDSLGKCDEGFAWPWDTAPPFSEDPYATATAAVRQVMKKLQDSGLVTAQQDVLETRLKALQVTANAECPDGQYTVSVFYHCTDEVCASQIVRDGFNAKAHRKHGALFSDGCDPSWVYGAPLLSSVLRYGTDVVLCVGLMRRTVRVMGRQPSAYLRRMHQAGFGVDSVVAFMHPTCITQLVFRPDHVVPVACGSPDAFAMMDSKVIASGGDLVRGTAAWLNVPTPLCTGLLTFDPAGTEFENALPPSLAEKRPEMTVEACYYGSGGAVTFRNLGTTRTVPAGVRARGIIDMHALLEQGRLVFRALHLPADINRSSFCLVIDRFAVIRTPWSLGLMDEENPRVGTHCFHASNSGSRGVALKLPAPPTHPPAPTAASTVASTVASTATSSAASTATNLAASTATNLAASTATNLAASTMACTAASTMACTAAVVGAGAAPPLAGPKVHDIFATMAAGGLTLHFGRVVVPGSSAAPGACNMRPTVQLKKHAQLQEEAGKFAGGTAIPPYAQDLAECVQCWKEAVQSAGTSASLVFCEAVKLLFPPWWDALARVSGPPDVAQLCRFAQRATRMVSRYSAQAKYPHWASAHVERCLRHWVAHKELVARELVCRQRPAQASVITGLASQALQVTAVQAPQVTADQVVQVGADQVVQVGAVQGPSSPLGTTTRQTSCPVTPVKARSGGRSTQGTSTGVAAQVRGGTSNAGLAVPLKRKSPGDP